MDCWEAAREFYRKTWDGAGLSALPAEWQRELVALMLVSDEIHNGGYLQFFANRGRETYEYASRALRTIGAHKSADIVDSCQALIDEHFPGDGGSSDDRAGVLPNEIIGRDGNTTKEPGSVLPDSVLARVSELSYEFMDFPDNFGNLAERHYGPLIEADGRK